jgi:triosephosphate isomerase (TIM)
MIAVNFKVYENTFNNGSLELAKICRKVEEKTKVKIIPIVTAIDARIIKEKVGGEIWIQNSDEFFEGACSGSISPLQAKAAGINGTLLNHSECRKHPGTIKKMLAAWPSDFKVTLCLNSLGQVEKWAKGLKVDYVAYEPKNLIGSKDKSVASEKPDVMKKMVNYFGKIPVLAGAGIHSTEDVMVSLKLGVKGILISSYIVKNANPEEKLTELAECFNL